MTTLQAQGPNAEQNILARAPSDGAADSGKRLADGWPGLSLAITIAILPPIADTIVRSHVAKNVVVDRSALAYACLALSFAAIVRILGRGRGLGFIGPLFIMVVVETILAILYSNALTPIPSPADMNLLDNLVRLRPGEQISSPQIAATRNLLTTVGSFDDVTSDFGYWPLASMGSCSLLLMILYWRPVRGPRYWMKKLWNKTKRKWSEIRKANRSEREGAS